MAEAFDENGIGTAVMNRLNKSAGFDIIMAWFLKCESLNAEFLGGFLIYEKYIICLYRQYL